jgi:glycosyltransferase involved in cell wall biosynthesis
MGLRILFLSRWFPYPPSNGSKLRIYNLLRGLAQQHEVTLLTFTDQPDAEQNPPELQTLCQEIRVVPWKLFNPRSWRARFGILSLYPRSMIDTFSPKMRQYIEQTLSTRNYDIVIASEIDMAVYSQYFQRIPALLDELQVGVPYERFTGAISPWQRFRYGLTWLKQRHYLGSILENFRVCTVVSDRERQLLSQAVTGYQSIEVIPNCIHLASYRQVQEIPEPNTLIFTGAFSFSPNYEAMVWFLREVYPLVQAQIPDVHLTITGNHENRFPPAHNVTLTGFVDDVHLYVARSWASIVPLFTGGGTRLKILEAMALGTPVVATSKGAEGLEVQTGKHLLVADTPEAFSQEVVRLLKEPDLRRQLADNAYQLVREKYDWEVVMPRFLHLVDRVANNGKITGGN